jgi:hypothetical protein
MLSLEQPSADGVSTRLLETSFLRDTYIDAPKIEGAVNVRGLEQLVALELCQATLDSFSAESLPVLASLNAHEARAFRLKDLPRLRGSQGSGHISREVGTPRPFGAACSTGDFRRWRRSILALRRVCEVDLRCSGPSLDAPSLASLQATGARLCLDELVPHKKKRTAPKRKLKAKDWSHPAFGFHYSAYAALVVGRLAEVEIRVSTFKELAIIAESVGQERSLHLSALTPHDLSKESAVYKAADEIAPVVVGHVIACSNADDGPMKVSAEAIRAALENHHVDAMVEELAGAFGTTELDEAPSALYLVCSGPLASACLALGDVHDLASDAPDGTEVLSGQRNDQSTHPEVVWGKSLASVSNEGTGVVEISGDFKGDLFLITSYD